MTDSPTLPPPTARPTLPPAAVEIARVARVTAFFHYYPELTWAYVFIALFLVMTIVVWYQTTFLYKGRFMHIITFTGCLEAFSYGMRVESVRNPSLNVFILTSLGLLIGPILLAFVNYLVSGWLVIAAGGYIKVWRWNIPGKYIARIFLASDVVCLLLQGAGGGMLAIANETVIAIGNAIVLAGLAVQIIFFTCFLYINVKLKLGKFANTPSLDRLFVGMFVTISLMYVRNVFRILEFGSIALNSWRNPGVIPSTEWVFFMFESLPILLTFVGYSAFNFAKYLDLGNPMPQWKIELAAAGELKGEGEVQPASSAAPAGGVLPKTSEDVAITPAASRDELA